ncbi:MAG: hypothetical protein JWP74_1153 [Marmoricola sp.]|nr:hypothetical protein [Marmoricola sp.]
MTDENDDAIRRLLHDARAVDPIPTEVAARLDATLAGLTGVSPAAPVPDDEVLAEVVPLRSRRGPRLLAAAAAVVLVAGGGVGITQLVRSHDSNTADSLATSPSAGRVPSAQPPALASTPGAGTNGSTAPTSALPVFTTAGFARQAAAFEDAPTGYSSLLNGAENSQKDATGSTGGDTVRSPDAGPAPNPTQHVPPATTGTEAELGSASGPLCVGPDLPETTSVPITFDGAPAVLVQHRAQGGSRVVQAWSCDGSTELATTSVPR